MDQPLILRTLEPADETRFFEGLKEWEGESLTWYTFDWKPGMAFPELLERMQKGSLGIDIPPQFVPSTMLYGFVNHKIVGRVNVRHRLNEKLLHRGGHIGYAVAPRFRGQGYATEMVRQSLPFCRKLGIDRILITCSETNEASWKLIERLGAVLENRVEDETENEIVRRYWLKMDEG